MLNNSFDAKKFFYVGFGLKYLDLAFLKNSLFYIYG